MSPDSVPLEPLQVLVVDDDVQMLRTLSDILKFKGYDARTASSGNDGLEAAGRLHESLAIALVDLRLPDMDGIDLIGRLHDLSSETEVVILTGNASLDTAVRALREHSFDYLTKPVEPKRLLDTMDRAGERWRRKLAESALGESEERLRSMFQAIGDSVFITDRAGRILDANRAALALSGYDLETLQKHSLVDLMLDPQGEETVRILGAAANELASPGYGEYVLRTRGGKPLVVEVITAAFTNDRYVHTARDQTDRRKLEDQLRQAQRLEAIGQLAGGVAHDFNNVLTAIKGYAHLVAADVEKETFAAEGLREIVDATDRAGRLTRQLLTFSRRQIFVPRILDLNEVIVGIEGMLRRLIPASIEFTTNLAEGTGSVRADKGQLEQVLMNLAVNAGDAMHRSGRLTISTSTRTLEETSALSGSAEEGGEAIPPGEYVLLTVSDTGSGMDDETLAHIFEPFFTTKEVGRGTGLGLATVYGIVKRSEGFIRVDSAPGEGTSFTLYFPRQEEIPDDSMGMSDAISTAMLTGSETILVAEDDPPVRSFIRKALEMHGYRVLAAGNPDEVLEAARNYPGTIHLLLSDLVMPGIGGRELAERVGELHRETRTILSSGYARTSSERQSLHDFDGYLEKPYAIIDLLKEVRRVLRKARGSST